MPRFSIKTLLLITTSVAVGIVAIQAVRGLAISVTTSRQIVEGMTKAEILEVAGKPHYVESDGSWLYNVWNGFVFFHDPLHVPFDENGKCYEPTF